MKGVGLYVDMTLHVPSSVCVSDADVRGYSSSQQMRPETSRSYQQEGPAVARIAPVSYTHLTLPTILRV